MAKPADTASSLEVSCSQSTQATIATADIVTQCTLKFFSNTASQTEARFSVTSESELDGPQVGASSERLQSSQDSAYSTAGAPAKQKDERISRCSNKREVATDDDKIQIGGKLYADQACQQRKRHETKSIVQQRQRVSALPYTCGVCKKHFRRKDSLLTHARVHTVKEADLGQRPARRDSAVPDNASGIKAVPDSSRQRSSSAEMMEEAISGEEEVAAGARVTEKRKMTQQQLRDDDSSSSSSDEDVVVPKRLLLEEQRKNQQLRRKLQVMRKMHRHLQARHGRMEDVLLNMLGTSSTRGNSCHGVPQEPSVKADSTARPAKQSGHSLPRPATSQQRRADKPSLVRVAPQRLPPKKTPSDALHTKELQEDRDPEPTGQRGASECRGLFEKVGNQRPEKQSGNSLPRPATSQHTRLADKPALLRVAPQRLSPTKTLSDALHDKESGASVRQESAPAGAQNNVSQEDLDPEPTGQHGASDTPRLFEKVGDQVHLGNGVFVSAVQWHWLLSQKRDSLFVKSVTKEVWGMGALHGRSITGAPCKRFLNTKEAGTRPKKRALSPKKLQAVGNAFEHYIAQAENEEPAKERRSKMNRIIAELLRHL